MSADLSSRPPQDSATGRWQRHAVVKHLHHFQQHPTSLRDFADDHGVPKSTLHDWNRRKKALDCDSKTADFLESPQGLQLLHAIVLAAHLVFSFLGHAGIRPLTRFLELAGLAPFIATSYGAHQKLADTMAQQILAFEAHVRPPLAAAMPHRTLTVCQDETFPKSAMCLVAQDPISRFLLAERFAVQRDADTWNTLMNEATADLKVTVVQQASDEASGLTAHARQQGMHHSPDLFHIVQDVNRATALPLKRRQDAAEAALAESEAQTRRHIAEQAAYRTGPRPPGHPPHFHTRIARAQQAEAAARAALAEAEAHRQARQDAVRGLSSAYHPFDLRSGSAQSTAAVESLLREHFDALDGLVAAAELPQRSRKLLAKSHRRLPQMVATVRFFWSRVTARVALEKWSLCKQLVFFSHLLPAAYLCRVARQAPSAEARHDLEGRARALVAPLVSDAERDVAALVEVEALAVECAGWFQRSSSCVEGRNGELALSEHARRGLSEKRLRALTVVANYAVYDETGTTAAQRFFGQAHADLFQWLFDHMPLPRRPKQKRPKLKKQTLLEAA